MKNIKLWVHQRGANEDELIIHPNDFPDVSIGDILEIYHAEETNRLLLQVKSLKTESQQKEIVSIDQSVASIFKLRQYKEVIVNKVKEADVELDLVELLFKDQYVSRRDMWRLKKRMMSTCAYISQKVEICGIRAQVNELWAKGDKVTCGAISENTKIAFRSSKSMCYLFVQMSSEMWEFDSNGDLYWEKAVNGFLKDLFTQWKQQNVNNELTIVFFSRRIYNAQSLDDFPGSMRSCLHTDYKGRLYEDFYKVIVLHERRDDWLPMLITLKQHFIQYLNLIVPNSEGVVIPSSYISSAAEGNFLEVLNISLNLFDKHYIDRNFDRTGQLVIMITSGAGVFEVDRELCNLTKQRMIDYGINTDLICMAEQPLHVTPLFRFHNKCGDNLIIDDYNIPHWMNHSFYRSKNQPASNNFTNISKFTPRIKLAERLPCSVDELPALQPSTGKSQLTLGSTYMADHYYDEHDENVFKMPSRRTSKSDIKSVRSQFGLRDTSFKDKLKLRLQRSNDLQKQVSMPDVVTSNVDQSSSGAIPIPGQRKNLQIHRNDDDLFKFTQKMAHSEEEENEYHEGLPQRVIVGSASAIHTHPNVSPTNNRIKRTLINPFAPSCATIRLTSNRRRWVHTFPQGPSGEAIQLHHQKRIQTDCSDEDHNFVLDMNDSGPSQDRIPHSASGISLSSQLSVSSNASVETVQYRGPPTGPGHRASLLSQLSPSAPKIPFSSRMAWNWSVTGEQEWTPFIQTGVDWKSITATACLPVTTDYFPDNFILQRDYMENQYDVSPDELVGANVYSIENAFMELVSQRLMHGFQMVISPQSFQPDLQQKTYRTSHQLVTNVHRNEYVLSIGRIFHRISLHEMDRVITVTMYKPRHPFVPQEFLYSYKLWPAKNSMYEEAAVLFRHEQVEHFNWNYMDNHICCKGAMDYDLMESLKFWRTRFLLLPSSSQTVRKLCESPGKPCDVFTQYCQSENQQLIEGFIKFMNILNKTRRHSNSNKKDQSSKKTLSGNTKPLRRASTTTLLDIKPRIPHLHKRPCSPVGRVVDKLDCQRTGSIDYINATSPSATPTNNNITELPQLSLKSPLQYIVNAMKKSESGLNFLLPDSKGLPNHSFLGFDAVQWIRNNLEDDTKEYEALELLQTMEKMNLIRPVCGKFSPSHCNGYYFFYFPTSEQTENNIPNVSIDPLLQRYLFEVKVSCNSNEDDVEPWSQQDDYNASNDRLGNYGQLVNEDPASNLFKNVVIDLSNTKTDSPEWCHVAYQQIFDPSQAFELKVQWLVSSSSLLSELLQGWSRKAQQCGFHLVPAPCDPFHFRRDASDPISSPLFIDLHVPELFKGEETGVTTVQEAILQRFGFIPVTQLSQNQYESSLYRVDYNQFVHVSGGAFAAIRSAVNTGKSTTNKSNFSPFRRSRSLIEKMQNKSMSHHVYSIDAINIEQKREQFKRGDEGKVGFFWATNHLLTKRWRSLGTGCEKFPTRLLNDFSKFCSDEDGRLESFWQEHAT
ncbi:GATOR1 complex protein DEPDC5-like isoform X2 [Antedon mediterranea]|uniref:GATOR1 complex protein DEPDC5-like isoform X2 n=1 Tax=Antedon mediterranea TaxID=105859 RepID=UPI003AF49FB5